MAPVFDRTRGTPVSSTTCKVSVANLDVVLTAVEGGWPDLGTSPLGKGKDRDDEPIHQGVEYLGLASQALVAGDVLLRVASE